MSHRLGRNRIFALFCIITATFAGAHTFSPAMMRRSQAVPQPQPYDPPIRMLRIKG